MRVVFILHGLMEGRIQTRMARQIKRNDEQMDCSDIERCSRMQMDDG